MEINDLTSMSYEEINMLTCKKYTLSGDITPLLNVKLCLKNNNDGFDNCCYMQFFVTCQPL